MKCREQHYATNTLAEHRRILTEGNRFKRDATRVIALLKDFTLTVSVVANTSTNTTKEGDGQEVVPSGSCLTTLTKKDKKGQKKKKTKKTKEKEEEKVTNDEAQQTSCSSPKPLPPPPREDTDGDKKSKAAAAAKKRMMRLKTGGKKQYTRAEVDAQLRDSLKRLVDWSQRAYKIMDKQMTDISKLYMATMTYNMHLNTPYVAKKTRV